MLKDVFYILNPLGIAEDTTGLNTTRVLDFEPRIGFGEKVKGEGLKVFSSPFPQNLTSIATGLASDKIS
ncbi:MAG: hypothetical protein RMZ41_002220 [Nostoc sp. DedVER02]|uniref:hypothetical protein n=1 Tax=unclassified Nostoc TaxID=2593658 RepID=UPI002AD40070|nr:MULTISPECIES: hypothetical protein [unclassified Nostoc]MDZ7987026.1 hypothetical protein [Nostoc sp. DedVER02]MDZ8116543.1 hypothetical protein [Nostoc sp. DedVER01b]